MRPQQPPPFNIQAETTRLHAARGKFTRRANSALNTEKGYGYDWAMFERWCGTMKLATLPATSETVSLYLTFLMAEGKKITTATRRASAIASMHRDHGFESPVIGEGRAVLRGARRSRTEVTREMQPLTVANLSAIAHELSEDGAALAIRDRAILVTGFASALRRSSLVALKIADLEFVANGVILHIRKEKQDQQGRGRLIGLPAGERAETCPVRCLKAWLKIRGDAPGFLFTHVHRGGEGRGLHPEAIERMVKRSVQRIGLDPQNFAGHSLRAGFITEAGEAGVGELLIAAQSGHRSMQVLRKYFRRSQLFKANACSGLGL